MQTPANMPVIYRKSDGLQFFSMTIAYLSLIQAEIPLTVTTTPITSPSPEWKERNQANILARIINWQYFQEIIQRLV